MKFTEMLRARWRNADTLLCVGLDPDLARLPEELAGKPDAIYSFCTGIVDATADLVCAFKPQIAYFASEGAEDALNRVVAYIHSNHPGIPVILDAKRGDIGSTAKHYAEEAFDRYGADCVTLSPIWAAIRWIHIWHMPRKALSFSAALRIRAAMICK